MFINSTLYKKNIELRFCMSLELKFCAVSSSKTKKKHFKGITCVWKKTKLRNMWFNCFNQVRDIKSSYINVLKYFLKEKKNFSNFPRVWENVSYLEIRIDSKQVVHNFGIDGVPYLASWYPLNSISSAVFFILFIFVVAYSFVTFTFFFINF